MQVVVEGVGAKKSNKIFIVICSPSSRPRFYPTSGRARRENIGERPNDPPIENGYALRREILSQADAELDCRIQEPFKVVHSTSGKVMQHHDCPGLYTALRKRAIDRLSI